MARLVVDRWLLERRPAPDLADWLVCVWRGDLGEAATPLPDERLDLVWVDDGSLWLSGPETSSWSRGYRPGTTAVGVGFKPAVGPPMLALAAIPLIGAVGAFVVGILAFGDSASAMRIVSIGLIVAGIIGLKLA